MPSIQRLSAHLANLIAAGEVVERPASVVKELLENAVDAGATAVTVEIQNGGMSFIRVADNGCGMSRADAEVAFLRHATSKLHSEEELASIGTLGFRGEALAAIAAVSHVDLLTSDGAEGTSLHLEAGTITRREEAACPQGTTIIVRDLFYNTPARLKFMKRDAAEGAQVHAVVQRQALANPAVRYRFLRDGQELLATSGDGELYSAIYAVLGRQLALDMVPVEGSWGETAIRGYVTRPSATRGNRNAQHFFVNGRYVRSKLMMAALEQAYQNQLPAGRFPGCVLHLHLPLQQVDVNIHPAKTEVKFLTEQAVFDAVYYGVLTALNRTPGRPEARLKAQTTYFRPGDDQPEHKPDPQCAAAASHAPAGSGAAAATAKPAQGFFRTMRSEDYRALAHSLAEKPPANASPAVQKQVFTPGTVLASRQTLPYQTRQSQAAPPPEQPAAPAPVPAAPSAPQQPAAARPAAPADEPAQQVMDALPPEQTWRLVGEVLQTYLVIEEPDGMLLIDKHAAHERILFETLRARQAPMMSQALLEPLPLSLGAAEAEAVLNGRALLEPFGYGVQAGDGGAELTRIPAELTADEALAGVAQLADYLLEGHEPDPAAMRDIALHTMACKAAVKAGAVSGREELEHLAREVMTRDDIKYCPHGRPVCISLSRGTIERQFGRA